MKISELFGRAGLEYSPETGDIDITNIVTDSRKVTPGCLFLCIKGLHTDGHQYVDGAIKAGARVIVAEQVRDACVGGAAAYIMLDNTRKSAALLYNARYGDPCAKLKIIGVTGTNGKTSTCVLLYRLFEAAGYRCGLIGTLGCYSFGGVPIDSENGDGLANMTTPDPESLYAILSKMEKDGVEYVFMEVSSHSLALDKVAAITFDTAVFTNLTRDHLDFHGDMEAYFRAKQTLFRMCRRAVVYQDDAYGKRIWNEITCPAVACSATEGDYCALDVELLGIEGSRYRLRTPKESISISLSIPGSFSVTNSLLASTVALEYGIPPSTVCEVLAHATGVDGRMERVAIDGKNDFSVLIDYAHTPDALEKLLKSVHGFRKPHQRIVLLFGCGGDRDRGKRKEMGMIATRLADHVILTSDNCRTEDPDGILSDVLKGIDKERSYVVIRDRFEAIEKAVVEALPGDILILAGKGHERYEINAKGRHSFDEREIVKKALSRRKFSSDRDTLE